MNLDDLKDRLHVRFKRPTLQNDTNAISTGEKGSADRNRIEEASRDTEIDRVNEP